MLNIVFCISEGNHHENNNQVHYRAVTRTYGYEESKHLLSHLLEELNITAESHVDAKLQLKYFGEVFLVDLRTVTHIRVQKRVVQVYISGKEKYFYEAYAKMSDLEKCLKQMGFIRVNRSHMVSIGYIKQIVGSEVFLTVGKSVKIGRKFKKNITELLQNKVVIGAQK
ncbi:MAG: LytTR family transcriptional regulator [Parasporobacterium sp.]|nr:LytTR family transcriptional regulator [Parasporobacterium sp.]